MSTDISRTAWQFQHSVDCNVPQQFAWGYWTNIANWNDPPATFHLDGPFAAGSKLTTNLPGQTLHSLIREVTKDCEAIIDMPLPGAALSFHWIFQSLSEQRTRMTQHLVLSGPDAEAFVGQASVFEKTIPEGMQKLAASIEESLNLES